MNTDCKYISSRDDANSMTSFCATPLIERSPCSDGTFVRGNPRVYINHIDGSISTGGMTLDVHGALFRGRWVADAQEEDALKAHLIKSAGLGLNPDYIAPTEAEKLAIFGGGK